MHFLRFTLTVVLFDLISWSQAGLLHSFASVLNPGGTHSNGFDVNSDRAYGRGSSGWNPQINQPGFAPIQNNGNTQLQLADKDSRVVYEDTFEPTTNSINTLNNGFNENRVIYDRGKSRWNPQINQTNTTILSSGDHKSPHQLTDKETQEVSKVFPEGINLLNKLQELNKLKEEGKLNIGNTNKPNVPTTMPVNKNPDRNVNEPTESSKVKDPIRVLKPLTKRKFYYQAQAVVPENERRDVSETIFYVE